MSYLRYWKLPRSPFSIGASGRGVFTGGTVEEALARSDFLVAQEKRLGLVLGPSGVGKSTFLKHFSKVRNAQQPLEKIVMINLRCADRETVPARILSGLSAGQEGTNAIQDSWERIHDHLYAEAAIGHRTVLLLDHVEGSNDEVFQAISQLWCSQNRWSMLLSVGDDSIVDAPRWILDQTDLKIDLPRWDLGQTADFFDFAFEQVGSESAVFNGQAITRIQELGEGIPKKMVQIAELALVAGAVRMSSKVTSELVDQVCDELTVPFAGKTAHSGVVSH